MPITSIFVKCFGVQPEANTLVELNQVTPVYGNFKGGTENAPQLIHLHEIDYVRFWDPRKVTKLLLPDCVLTKIIKMSVSSTFKIPVRLLNVCWEDFECFYLNNPCVVIDLKCSVIHGHYQSVV